MRILVCALLAALTLASIPGIAFAQDQSSRPARHIGPDSNGRWPLGDYELPPLWVPPARFRIRADAERGAPFTFLKWKSFIDAILQSAEDPALR